MLCMYMSSQQILSKCRHFVVLKYYSLTNRGDPAGNMPAGQTISVDVVVDGWGKGTKCPTRPSSALFGRSKPRDRETFRTKRDYFLGVFVNDDRVCTCV